MIAMLQCLLDSHLLKIFLLQYTTGLFKPLNLINFQLTTLIKCNFDFKSVVSCGISMFIDRMHLKKKYFTNEDARINAKWLATKILRCEEKDNCKMIETCRLHIENPL